MTLFKTWSKEDEKNLVKKGVNRLETVFSGVILVTFGEFVAKILIGIKGLIDDPCGWVEDIINTTEKKKVSHKAILKIRKDVYDLKTHFAINKKDGKDGDGVDVEKKKKKKE
ncbi:hypothetical protein RHGRI_017111 [Rhododendron griersonianum]|uniref:Uncharacterized protein n=1 Tax=Rhododendron griersonianum TaxID=479676 RepID=A0AAV6JWP0_9ERIC|nr:hypothetical protein RHGRI_017111 [Rhododendron griersonianum]